MCPRVSSSWELADLSQAPFLSDSTGHVLLLVQLVLPSFSDLCYPSCHLWREGRTSCCPFVHGSSDQSAGCVSAPTAAASWMEVWGAAVLLETLIWCVRCEASAHGPLQASGTELSTKQEVRPYHLDSILFFPGTPVSFAGDKFVISRACALMIVIEVSTNLSWFILYFLFISIIELMIMNENNGFYSVGMRIKLSMMTLLTFFLSPVFQHYHPCQHHRWMGMACRLTFLIFYSFINLLFLFPGL